MKKLHRIVVATALAFVVSLLTAQLAAAAPLKLPLFKQAGQSWSGLYLDTGKQYTIGEKGCALTSFTMVAHHYGADKHPGQMRDALFNGHGLAANGDMMWSQVQPAAGGGVRFVASIGGNMDRVNSELAAGVPLIVRVPHYGAHWVVLTGRDGGTYYMNDPFGSTGANAVFNSVYGDPASQIKQVIIYHGPTKPPAEPGSPRTVSTGADWATLAWADRSNDETCFRVRYRVGTGAWTEVPAVPAGSVGATVKGLKPLTHYIFQVGARNSAGTKWSAYFPGDTKEPLPAQPLNPRPEAREQTSIVLAWDDVSKNERGFSVQYKIGSGAWKVLKHVAPPNAQRYKVTGLTPGTQYIFQVGAWSTGGTKWSTYAYIRTKPTAPAKPGSPRVVSTTTSSAVIAWTDVATNESHYRVQYKIGNGSWTEVKPWLAANSTTCTITGLAANTPYIFQVGARNETSTSWSDYCYGRTQSPPSRPAQPLNPKCVSTTSNSAYLTWTDASGNETDFRVQYRVGGGAWVQASATAPANATSITVTGLSPSTDYTFQVGARNAVGTSWSEYCYGRTQTAVNPAYLRKILRLSDGSAWLITARGTRAWIPTGGDYQAIVNNGVPVVNTDWATISQYPASGYYAVVTRMDDPAISGPSNWIIYRSGNGAGWENDYYLTQSAAGKSYTTNTATWSLSNGRGLVRVNAYIPTLEAKAGVVYHVYDGSRHVASVAVNQNVSYRFIQLGTWEFSSGTIVVRINDNEGAGPYGTLMGFDCVEGIPVG